MTAVDVMIASCRVDCKDTSIEAARAAGYDLVQPKYDGWWALVEVKNRVASIYSSGGRLLQTYPVNTNTHYVLVGEFMYGQEWALAHEPGTVWLHDVLLVNGRFIHYLPYHTRSMMLSNVLQDLESQWFRIVPTGLIANAEAFWQTYVVELGYEGLVYKRAADPLDETTRFGRTKRKFTMDYVIMGMVEGQGKHAGRLGALVCGLHRDGKLVEICNIGMGFTDSQREEFWQNRASYLGQVVEATGMGLFASGALRHGSYNRLRPDKAAERCKIDKF